MHQLGPVGAPDLCPAQCAERGPANAERGGLKLDKSSLLKLKAKQKLPKQLENVSLEDAT